VLFLEWHGKAIDYGSLYLKQVRNPQMLLCLKHIVQEHLGHRFPPEGTIRNELGVYLVVHVFQTLAFHWILRLEKCLEVAEERMINSLS